jgi:DNA repair ATPase RecN
MAGIKGLDSFLDVLELVKDPKKFDSKIKEIKAETDKYQSVVEAVVKLSEVDDYITNIKSTNAKAEQALSEATEKAETLVNTARVNAKAVLDEASKTKEKANTMLRDYQDKLNDITEKESQLAKERTAFNAEVQKLSTAKEETEELNLQLRLRLEKLKNAMV